MNAGLPAVSSTVFGSESSLLLWKTEATASRWANRFFWMSALQCWLLARPHFIFLTIFLESNKQYEYICRTANLVRILQVCAAGRGGGGFIFWRGWLEESVQTVQQGNSNMTVPVVKLSAGWVSPVPLRFHCASLEQRAILQGCSPPSIGLFLLWSHADATVLKISNYHSVTVTAPLCFTQHKWQFLYQSSFWHIMGWLTVPPSQSCAQYLWCVRSGGRGLVCWSIFSVESDRHSTCST